MNRWELLATTIAKVDDLDGPFMEIAGNRQLALAKPVNALGRLEHLGIRLAGITRQLTPALSPRTAIICAGDHGITAEQVSAFPSSVTAQMVCNFLAGGAAANVLARQNDVNVVVVDVGIAEDLPTHPKLRKHKIQYGTENLALRPAMSRHDAITAIEVGIQVAMSEAAAGSRLFVVGDMGIGNTTVGAAIAAMLTELPVTQVTGMGTGIGLLGWRRKCEVIERALELHLPDPNDPIDVLSKIGGFEVGAIAGIIIASAAERIPVIVDGLVATAGAAIASKLCAGAKSFMMAGHRSVEPGHGALLDYLDLTPILDLDLAMGEGCGAILAIPVLEAAVATLNEMATFEDTQIEYPHPIEMSSNGELAFA